MTAGAELPAYDTYVTVIDDTGRISVDVPTAWADVDGTPVSIGGSTVADIRASSDLAAFASTWTTPGVIVSAGDVPGVTPEAPTVDAAFGGGVPADAVVYGAAERAATYARLNDQGTSTQVDFVLLGCPHASLDQIRDVARLLDGRRLHDGTSLWIMAPRALAAVAERSGYTATIEAAGAKVLTDSCPAMSRLAPPGTRVFATDSAKQAHYLPAILGIEAWFGTTEDCVQAAVTGRWSGELR